MKKWVCLLFILEAHISKTTFSWDMNFACGLSAAMSVSESILMEKAFFYKLYPDADEEKFNFYWPTGWPTKVFKT